MAHDVAAPLNELCSICHTDVPKYRCPRCSLQTCSLQCVKRHKLRSQCSGTRNPAAYLRRNELATPTAFDQDFNFITGVERSLDRAAQDVEDRGVRVHSSSAARYPRNESKIEKEIKERQVIVEKAPVGLSRSKQNQTRWDQTQNCVFWTVEWITEQDQKGCSTIAETLPISTSYTSSRTKKIKQRHKRKRIGSRPEGLDTGRTQHTSHTDGGDTGLLMPKDDNPEPQSASAPAVYFYLHRPHTPSKIRCLIPLGEHTTLMHALRNRVVVEFPTVFVLSQPPSDLPSGYITEEEYLKMYEPTKVSTTGAEAGLPKVYHNEGNANGGTGTEMAVDENQVLAVLQKDLELGTVT